MRMPGLYRSISSARRRAAALVVALGMFWLSADRMVRGAEGENAVPPPEAPAAAWKLERVTLTDGKTYDGLVESERPAEIEFIEVHQPAGKPMSLVVHSIDRKIIETLERVCRPSSARPWRSGSSGSAIGP